MLDLKYLGDDTVYEVNFSWVNEHVVQLLGNFPAKITGFTLTRHGYDDQADYSAFTTVYRTLDNGVQFSDDGSIWIEPLTDVVVNVVWNDNDNEKGIRPLSIDGDVFMDGSFLETVNFNSLNEWSKTYVDQHLYSKFTVTAADVEGYTKNEYGTTITYSIIPDPVPPTPTIEDRVDALEEESLYTQIGLADTFEMLQINNEELLNAEIAIAEIYEIIAPEEG